MSYNKRTWANGNVVGAVDLNRMEQGVESGQNGYECTEESTVLTDETVTTTYDSDQQVNLGNIAYSQLINADKIRVTFNGVEYECNAHTHDGLAGKVYGYGGVGEEAVDFSEYPFVISSAPIPEGRAPASNVLCTSSAGTHTVKIEAFSEVVNTTECFEKAVKKFVGYECNQVQTVLTEESVTPTGTPPIAYLVYSELISSDSIAVTFDDVEYVLERITGQTPSGEPAYVYGDSSDPSAPFVIFSTISPSDVSKRNGVFISSSSGTHAITIEAVNVSVEASDGFKRAVKFVSGGSLLIEGGKALNDALNHTFAEIKEAIASGRSIIFHYVPSGTSELSEFYTQDVEVRFNDSTRYVSVMYRELERYVVYIAQSDDEHPYIRLD